MRYRKIFLENVVFEMSFEILLEFYKEGIIVERKIEVKVGRRNFYDRFGG